MGSFPLSHLLFCPTSGILLTQEDLDDLGALVERCTSKREYMATHWRRTPEGTLEAQVQFKGGPHEALEEIWKTRSSRFRCIWVRDTDESGGRDWIYKIDDENLEDDLFYNPCDRRAWYAFDDLQVILEPGSTFELPSPWGRDGNTLFLRERCAYFSDTARHVHELDGPPFDTPTTPTTGDAQPVLGIDSLQGVSSLVIETLDRHAVRIDASYQGRRVRHCVRAHRDDTWPRWLTYPLDHWDNCLDEEFLRDQSREAELLPGEIYALPHPRL